MRNSSKRHDEIGFVSRMFEGTVSMRNKEFLLLVGSGIIPGMYMKTGKAPEQSARGFVESDLFSVAKVE